MTLNSRFLAICVVATCIALVGCTGRKNADESPEPAANDMFLDAITITKPGTVTGTILDATREYGESDHGGRGPQVSIWWRYAADANGTLTVTAESDEFDPTVAAYSGIMVNALQIPAGAVRSKPAVGQSSFAFRVEAGRTYHIAVAAASGATGTVTVRVQDSSAGR